MVLVLVVVVVISSWPFFLLLSVFYVCLFEKKIWTDVWWWLWRRHFWQTCGKHIGVRERKKNIQLNSNVKWNEKKIKKNWKIAIRYYPTATILIYHFFLNILNIWMDIDGQVRTKIVTIFCFINSMSYFSLALCVCVDYI